MRVIIFPAFTASSRQRSSSSNSAFSSGTSFFNGWRATPGIIPATSQLVLLISTTATNVSSWRNGIRHLDKSLLCGMGHSLGWSNGEDAIALPCPIGSQELVPPGCSKKLQFPKLIARGAPPLRPERHIPNSIATIRRRLSAALAKTLSRCPCCVAPISAQDKTSRILTQ
jgi:hypothetical protein